MYKNVDFFVEKTEAAFVSTNGEIFLRFDENNFSKISGGKYESKKIIGLILALVMCLGIMTPFAAFAADFEEIAEGSVVYYEDFSSLADADHTGKDDAIGAAHGFFGGTDKGITNDFCL